MCRNCGRSHNFESVCMSKSEKYSPNKQSQHKPKYVYQNKHSSDKHYGKKSIHKHKKISSVKDNEQSHSDDESYFVNTIQDEEPHDTCVKLRFPVQREALIPQLILVLVLMYVQFEWIV